MSPRALLSVYDKAGIVDLARGLVGLGWEIVSSGGTATLLAGEGVAVTEVAEVTSATACGFYGLTIPDSSGN
jgi:phosphoribosylaminoimidazolecarboxamide formyltransferase/IMP cyclohydrolase